jgi:hypothetical protein
MKDACNVHITNITPHGCAIYCAAAPIKIPGRCYGATQKQNPDGSIEIVLTCCCVFNEDCATVDKGPFSIVNPVTHNGELEPSDYLTLTLNDGTVFQGPFLSHYQNSVGDPGQLIKEHRFTIIP